MGWGAGNQVIELSAVLTGQASDNQSSVSEQKCDLQPHSAAGNDFASQAAWVSWEKGCTRCLAGFAADGQTCMLNKGGFYQCSFLQQQLQE